MKQHLSFLFACLVLCASISLSGCQSNQGFGAQPYGAPGQVYQQPPVFGQGAQGFGQDLGRRFANGFLNRGVFGVVNYVFQAIGF